MRNREAAFWIVCATLAGILACLVCWGVFKMAHWNYDNPQTMICQVESKDRTSNGNGGSDIRIYSKDCPVLTIQDLLFAGDFDTADVYQQIEPGHTYRFDVTGHRTPFLSSFQVIRSVTPVE